MKNNKTKRNGWKITAVIFIILFCLQCVGITWYIVYVINYINTDEEYWFECVYTICEDYEDYWYGYGICSCYSYTDEGYGVLEETVYMK